MKLRWTGTVLLAFLVLAGSLFAGTVYFWTDEDGVRHYSNTGLPGDVQEAQERPEEISPQVVRSPDDADTDAELDEGLTDPQEGVPGQEAPVVEEGQRQDQRLAARIEKERRRLEAEIKRIQGLSIGKSFTPGMKEAQIRPLLEQLALLDADPERYFRMKRQGAFGNASGPDSGGATASPSDALPDTLKPLEPAVSTGPSNVEESPPPEEP